MPLESYRAMRDADGLFARERGVMLPPGSESAVDALFNASDIAAARDILRLHPQLVDGTSRRPCGRSPRTFRIAPRASASGAPPISFGTRYLPARPGVRDDVRRASRAPRAFELMKIGTQFLTEPDDRVALALLREYPDSP